MFSIATDAANNYDDGKKRISSTIIREGSLAFIYLSPRFMYPTVVRKGERFYNKSGCYYHDDMIGRRYGTRVGARLSNGSISTSNYVHLLLPTMELWTQFLPHRTQIVYTPDISIILTLLDLKPGSRAVESGTGSASLTHSLARTVAPIGHVYTFEFHQQRAIVAQKELTEHGLCPDLITVTNRDVCKDGFSVINNFAASIDGYIDAVFLDLPEPWLAIYHVPRLFNPKRAGRICCYSPCMEQVQKTCAELSKQGFTDIRMIESVQRSLETKLSTIPDLETTINRRSSTVEAHKQQKSGDNCTDIGITNDGSQQTIHTTRAASGEIKGHTAYLTFATFLPQ